MDWPQSNLECPSCSGTGFVERRDEHPEVRAAIDSLPPEKREPFVKLLRWYDDLTDKQLATINAQSKVIQHQQRLLDAAEPKTRTA
jgi:DNA-directed RNA polymerase specialized sigma24 family protein